MLLPNALRAKELRAELAKGKDFAELARQWSLAPSATRGGELDWVTFKSPPQEGETAGLPLPIAQAVEKLQKGKVSEPIEVQGKWWLVKLDDVAPRQGPDLRAGTPGHLQPALRAGDGARDRRAGPAARPGGHDHPLVRSSGNTASLPRGRRGARKSRIGRSGRSRWLAKRFRARQGILCGSSAPLRPLRFSLGVATRGQRSRRAPRG